MHLVGTTIICDLITVIVIVKFESEMMDPASKGLGGHDAKNGPFASYCKMRGF